MVSLRHQQKTNTSSQMDFDYTYETSDDGENDSPNDSDYIPYSVNLKPGRVGKGVGERRDSSKSSFGTVMSNNTKKMDENRLKRAEEVYQIPGKRQRCFSKNALMARENRLKKKRYIENLEGEVGRLKGENGKLSTLLESQSTLIVSLRKEVKYLKSVLANSSEISKLLRCVSQNSDLPLTTSLKPETVVKPVTTEALSPALQNDFIDKPIKFTTGTQNPQSWTEPYYKIEYQGTPTPSSSTLSPQSSTSPQSHADVEPDRLLSYPGMKEDDTLLLDDAFPSFDDSLTITEDNLLDFPLLTSLEEDFRKEELETAPALNECNMAISGLKNQDDVGVCLHVANNRVSLEFCSNCSSSAMSAWNDHRAG